MPGVKVLIKGLNKVIDFPVGSKMDDIGKHIQGNWSSVEEMSGLPMDKASRMERAKYMGFDVDTTYYHGSPDADFPSFNEDQFFTESPEYASRFTSTENASSTFYGAKGDSQAIIPVKLKGDVFDTRNPEHRKIYEASQLGKNIPLTDSGLPDWAVTDDVKDLIEDSKFKSFMVDEGVDAAGKRPPARVVTDPKNIRSVNATFDPSKKESANLLAGVGGAAVGLSALSPEQAQASQQAQKSFIESMLSDQSLESLPSFTTATAPGIDQMKLPQQYRADVGGYQAPVAPLVNQFGHAIGGYELPIIGDPVEGLSNYLINFGYDDPAAERLKRAAMAGLDVI